VALRLVNRVNANFHGNNANVTHIFNRWARQSCHPHRRAAKIRGRGKWTSAMDRWSGRLPGVAETTPTFARSPNAAAAGTAPGARPTPAARHAPAQNFQGFRRQGGQWQQFQGNGHWQDVNPAD
jgi:hypothetical protein